MCSSDLKRKPNSDPIARIKRDAGIEPSQNGTTRLTLVPLEDATIHASIIWVVHYDKDSEIVYTGADDGTFVAFHMSNFQTKESWFVKRFPVGVTSINTIDDVVAVGR